MNRFTKHFNRPRVLLPVVHCVRPAQVYVAINCVMSHGADGVWLINQGGMSISAMLASANAAVRGGVPFVGINVLGASPTTAGAMAAGAGVHGLWSDDAGININDNMADTMRDGRASRFLRMREDSGWDGLYFGGIAFKYRDAVDPAQYGATALRATAHMDVVTTSGDATGEPPPVEKLMAMRQAIGDYPLANASGITPENVDPYLSVSPGVPLVNAFFVASGIESSFGEFDPGKVRSLAEKIHRGTR